MKTTSWKCSHLQALALAVALLSVFAWGLQYKLSLYRSGDKNTATPTAKLLSPKERAVNSVNLASFSGDVTASLFIFVAASLLLLLGRPAAVLVPRTRLAQRSRQRDFAASSFSRPPPQRF